jgi:GTP-binding protein
VKFVDEVSIEVASGKGGPGCVSFRREIFVPRGGPDGGDGGRGGHVIFKTSTRVHSLLDLKFKVKYRAEDGEAGKSQNRTGSDGKDLFIIVPPGTIIKTMDGETIRDLGPDEEFIYLMGGIGGKGNTFYKTSVNQAPSVAQKGMPGEEAKIHLELKLLADVGIIGFPNAGKSTLISRISAAKPKVADYPFTTLIPNLGVVRFSEESNFIVADMPGLIKGAHKGVGLGTRFLRHIERTKCFVHLVDAGGLSGRDPVQDYKDINNELKMYDREHKGSEDFHALSGRQQIIVLNKMDLLPEGEQASLIKKFEKFGNKVICISAVTGFHIKELVNLMGKMVFDGEVEENEGAKRKDIAQKADKESHKRKTKAKNKAKAKIKTKAKGKVKAKPKKKIRKKS